MMAESEKLSRLEEMVKENSYADIPCRCLHDSAIAVTSRYLDIESSYDFTKDGLLKDWRGLAELVDIHSSEIDLIKAKKENCTAAVLTQWKKRKDCTLGVLVSYLKQLERYDILEDKILANRIEENAKKYLDSLKPQQEEEWDTYTVPGPSSMALSSQIDRMNNLPSNRLDETEGQLVVDDVIHKQKTMFDAFVSYDGADIKFVKCLIKQLEKKGNLKLCVEARDLLAGQSHLRITAKLIQERCKKIIIVLSNNFLKSDICDFQLKFAQYLSPGSKTKRLVPVILEKLKESEIPVELKFVTMLFYNRTDVQEWFWRRLISSVQSEINEMPEVDQEWNNDSLPCNRDPDSLSICPDALPSKLDYSDSDSMSSVSSDSESDHGYDSLKTDALLEAGKSPQQSGFCSQPPGQTTHPSGQSQASGPIGHPSGQCWQPAQSQASGSSSQPSDQFRQPSGRSQAFGQSDQPSGQSKQTSDSCCHRSKAGKPCEKKSCMLRQTSSTLQNGICLIAEELNSVTTQKPLNESGKVKLNPRKWFRNKKSVEKVT